MRPGFFPGLFYFKIMLVKKMFPKQRAVKASTMSLHEFYEARNKVLIIRNSRGIGDILTCRMMFEDFKRVMPDMKLIFACQKNYHSLVRGHPFVDEIVDCTKVDLTKYIISYDISNCCIRWECANAPHADRHRADIWAEHCGVILTKHAMHLPYISKDLIQSGVVRVRQARAMSPKVYGKNSPNILFTPITFDSLRTLTVQQINLIVNYLKSKGFFVYSTHTTGVSLLEDLGVPVLSGYNLDEWASFIHAADYVITADTSTFHYAGGIKKPMTGIFTYADGKIRGKYFDFVLVQKHRDNGNWPCGPCYNHAMCKHPKCKDPSSLDTPKPCLTELSHNEIIEGIENMLKRWPVKN